MKKSCVVCSLVLAVMLTQSASFAQDRVTTRSLTTTSVAQAAALRDGDGTVTALARSGELQRLATFADPLAAGRRHERFQQMVNGVPVWGGTVTRQVDDAGMPVSIFGELYEGLDAIDTEARLSPEDARRIVAADAGTELGPVPSPLFVLVAPAEPRLVYVIRVATPALELLQYFVDAQSGAIVDRRDDRKQQSVGVGTGVFGSDKKISTLLFGSTFYAADFLRPPVLETYDFRGNTQAVLQVLNGQRPFIQSDLAFDGDNRWTDSSVVDAHVHSGCTYDYLFKRFGRLGLDDRNLPILNIVHAFPSTNRSENMNAFYLGGGLMVYGDGLPPGLTAGGQTYEPFAGALDIVAHELAHGVTDYTSRLIYRDESGALNESFSDMIGTSVEFFFQPPGNGRGQADYLFAEDVVRPGGGRSMANPTLYGQPDHYSRFVRTTQDNGGVHINSGIPNNAFYLAIEGGRNATSGLTVTGVGGVNREQIEKVFYRAFTTMLPANARFSTARAATIQAARDLYGAGSTVERAVTEAWTAVGVL
jgi:thermolysin